MKDDGYFQVAMDGPHKAFVKGAMKLTGADKGFDRTIAGMTGNRFSPGDVKVLEDRVLDKARWPDDVRVLRGVAEGPPVNLTQYQKAVVDRLVRGLGSDPSAKRAQEEYDRAIRAGQVRVR